MKSKLFFTTLALIFSLSSFAQNWSNNTAYHLWVDSYGVLYGTFESGGSEHYGLVRCPPNYPGTVYTVRSDCDYICSHAFQGCKNIKKIIFEKYYNYVNYSNCNIAFDAFDDSGI